MLEDYLKPTATITSDHPQVIELAEHLAAAADEDSPPAVARELFRWVRDNITYDVKSPFHRPEHYRPEFILRRRCGFCIPKAVLLAALCRARGIPARLVFADIVNHRSPQELREMMGTNVFSYHCYNELWLEGRWLKVVCSFDAELCRRHDFPLVEFDGRHQAMFPKYDQHGRPFIEYLADHGPHADLPLEHILAAWRRAYGPERVDLWMAALEPAASAGTPA